ncbi:hypothetical protein [Streptomyces sp. G1]|uniref:hypothetical protein n=1 Tax=Streptomyces sp. G1 TaxID=361572 RepID=UPI00202E5846|nr:hypothetical protein [Streptomyces sp. G1]MCM1976798.1 hypothetical protein [Streptomyces sp. G1]
MPYQPHKQVTYRIAEPHEFPDQRTVHISPLPSGGVEFLLRRGHARPELAREFTLQTAHLIVHGDWREYAADTAGLERPPLGLLLGVSRWEAVQPEDMPDGHLIYPTDYDGGSIVAVRADTHTDQLRHDTNDLLLRAVGDGLWNQHWPHTRPPAPPPRPAPLSAPTATLAVLL